MSNAIMAKAIEKLVKAIKEKTASNESLTGADFLQLLNDQLVEIGAEPITLAQSQHLFSPEQESYLKVLHERENLLKSITTLGVATGQWVSQYKKDMTYREAMLVLAAVKDKMDVETTKATKTNDVGPPFADKVFGFTIENKDGSVDWAIVAGANDVDATKRAIRRLKDPSVSTIKPSRLMEDLFTQYDGAAILTTPGKF